MSVFPVLVLALCAGCGSDTPEMPPVPEVALDTLSGAVHEQVAEAVAALDDAPRNARANGHLGMLLEIYGKTQPASTLYERAIVLEPETFRWQYLSAQVLIKLGNDTLARERLEYALQLRPRHPAAELALAQLLTRAGEYDPAQQLYEGLLQRNPSYTEAYAGLGQLLLDRGEPQSAIEPLSMAVALSEHYGQAHYALSQAYRQLGEDGLAVAHAALFERYRKFGPPSRDPLRREMQRLDRSEASRLQRALADASRGRPDLAIAGFESMIAESPQSASPHINLVAIYGQMQQYDEAERHARRAAELDPDSVELADNLGVMRLRQGRFDEAAAHFRSAVELDPENPTPHKNLGAALASSGDDAAAIASYTRALELNPAGRTIRFLLGNALLENGQADRAVAVLEPLREIVLDDTADHLYSLGRALHRAARHEQALQTLEEAHRLALSKGQGDLAGRIGNDLAGLRANR